VVPHRRACSGDLFGAAPPPFGSVRRAESIEHSHASGDALHRRLRGSLAAGEVLLCPVIDFDQSKSTWLLTWTVAHSSGTLGNTSPGVFSQFVLNSKFQKFAATLTNCRKSNIVQKNKYKISKFL
jgi:hypothetical protein